MAKSFDQLVIRTTTKAVRAKAARRSRTLLAELLLSEIRMHEGKSQSELAKVLGIKQPSLSKLEKQEDMQISTLSRIVAALGGELRVSARFPKRTIRLSQFERSPRSKATVRITGSPPRKQGTE